MEPAERFAVLVEELAGSPEVVGPGDSGSRGFGASALKVGGAIFAMLRHDRLVVKLPAGRVAALIADGVGEPFDTGKGTPMKEWLAVAVDDDDTWLALAREALAFVGARHR